mgnify:CR=1 FL=1
MFGLTQRQLIFFALAALVAVPTYFLTRNSLGNDIALILLIATALPFFFFALYEKNGQHRKRCLKNYFRVRFLTQQARPYRTENRFAALERQAYFDEEVKQLVSITEKAEPKRAVGWGDELIIRPDTPLSAAQKKQLAKAIRRAKRDGKIAATAQQTDSL